jgi:hypothetical protein
LLKGIQLLPKCWQPCRLIRRLIQGGEPLDPCGNSMGVAAQRVLLHRSLKEDDALASSSLTLFGFLSVEFGQGIIERSRPAVQIVAFGSVGDFCQHSPDEVIFVAVALPSPNDIECDLDGAFQFRDRLLEIQLLLGRSQTRSKIDNDAALQTGTFSRPQEAARIEDGD